jgi:hypothetical protein
MECFVQRKQYFLTNKENKVMCKEKKITYAIATVDQPGAE